ncbi:hypothetical protein DSO57_1027014 [Entomophthora muscae]|uniref:Uncharacterized protein n=1 Tax=Entomophthora muscae TaxID=34485 RepID=A0ACC2U006_9FUNG|nr:hypothetical protein DSO57_1027014 [Entomophthora muscae]
MLERFANLGHLGHLAMITVPIGSVIAGLNLGALAHQVGNLFPIKWVSDRTISQKGFQFSKIFPAARQRLPQS